MNGKYILPGLLALSLMTVRLAAAEPVPPKEDLLKALQKVRELFAEKYQHKRDDEQAALAQELLRASLHPDHVPAARYVLLRESADLAAKAGRATVAREALAHLTDLFDVDPVTLPQEVMETAAKSAKSSEDIQTVHETLFEVFDIALSTDRMAEAGACLKTMQRMVTKSKDDALRDEVKRRQKEFERLSAAYEKAMVALTTLKTMPDDGLANLVAGHYLALLKNDWARGLPCLARSSDPVLRKLAQTDLANPKEPEAIVALGDGYWDRADNVRDSDSALRLRLRAAYHYRRSLNLNNVAPLDKGRLIKRLDDIAKAEQELNLTPTLGNKDPDSIFVLNFEPDTLVSERPIQRVFRDLRNGLHAGARQVEVEKGVAGQCVRMQPVRQAAIWVQPDPALQFADPFSISLWLSTTNEAERPVGWSNVVACGDGSTVGFAFSATNAGYSFSTAGPEGVSAVSLPPGELGDGNWHHVVLTSTNREIRIYVDGRLSRRARSGTMQSPTTGLSIGSNFPGAIDEVAVFPNALTEREIARLRRKGQRGEPLQ